MKFKAFEKFKKIVNEYDPKSEKDIIKEIDVDEKNFKQWIEVLLGKNNQVDELDMEKLPHIIDKMYQSNEQRILVLGCMILEATFEKIEFLTNLEVFDDNPRFILDDMVGLFDTKEAKGKEAILSTYLVLDGYGLSEESEVYKLDKYIANKIEKSLYIIESGLQSSDVMELIRRLETMELDITRVVIYVHSIGYQVLHELRRNLKNLRNNKSVELIERY